jgi:hypothetical protein
MGICGFEKHETLYRDTRGRAERQKPGTRKMENPRDLAEILMWKTGQSPGTTSWWESANAHARRDYATESLVWGERLVRTDQKNEQSRTAGNIRRKLDRRSWPKYTFAWRGILLGNPTYAHKQTVSG